MTYYSTVAVISAMDEEAAHIADSLENVTVTKGASLNVIRGTYRADSGRTIHVGVTVGGMGLVNAAATTQYLVDLLEPDAVLFSGIAGNLTDDLHVNDIVLGRTLRYLDTDMRLVGQWTKSEEFHSDPDLMHMAEETLDEFGINHKQGVIASGNYFVDDDAKVKDVKKSTGADAVEMEGAAVVHVAQRNGVPALVIRAMSDNADTDYEEFKDFDISEYADTAARIVLGVLKRM